MEDTIKVHETAFVTATFRAFDEKLSRDKYSKLWCNSKTDKWIAHYLDVVSKDEPYLHCLRNRYFLETISELISKNKIEVLINVGCGYSMYPFLLPEDIINIEVDQEEVISHKSKTIHKWMNDGTLPHREINYAAGDFIQGKEELIQKINSIVQHKPSFILIEGVLFFLNKKTSDDLWEMFIKIQTTDGYVGSVSFLDSIVETTCFQRLAEFYKQGVTRKRKFEYLTLPTSFYENLKQYDMIEHEDYTSLSKEYDGDNCIIDGDSILNEQMYLLRKKRS